MDNVIKWLMCWGMAAFLGYFVHSLLFDRSGKSAYISPDKVAYIPGTGKVFQKININSGYELHFTYPENSNSYKGKLSVSEKEFSASQIGDEVQIYYGKHFPHLWQPYRQTKFYVAGGIVAFLALLPFLSGLVYLIKAIKLLFVK